jgi:hypothetical protein
MGLNFANDPTPHAERVASLVSAMREHPVGPMLASESDLHMMADLVLNEMDRCIHGAIERTHEFSHMADKPHAGLIMLWFIADGLRHSAESFGEPLASAMSLATIMQSMAEGDEGMAKLDTMLSEHDPETTRH